MKEVYLSRLSSNTVANSLIKLDTSGLLTWLMPETARPSESNQSSPKTLGRDSSTMMRGSRPANCLNSI